MNTKTRFVKSFSKGQITIPKEFRKALGWEDEFWLKLSVREGKLVAEPIEKNSSKAEYRKKLLTIKGNWINPGEIKRNREEIEARLRKIHL